MAERSLDPYRTLGISANASEDEVRAAYRRLVQLHHPDHNGGSAESARRFEAVQEAYAQIRSARPAAPRIRGNWSSALLHERSATCSLGNRLES